MTTVEACSPFESTSAGGALLVVRHVREPVLVGVMLAGLGTSAAHALPVHMAPPSLWPMRQTTAGASVGRVARASAAIGELRRLTGFTWEQIARLFTVSRRSLHFWASGKAMTAENKEHLQRLLLVLRSIDRGSASANRAELLAARDDGTILFDLLGNREYDRVLSLLGGGAAKRVNAPRLSEAAMAARAPRPPEELVDALQDRVHRETGITRPARSVRVRGGR
ncbi:MAG: XRE family transcriptional regulator [Candidatus Rokubacteria bacterium]|nr:XRE family transcriptional regulator [Candidatus Rokubacteria bacterium]